MANYLSNGASNAAFNATAASPWTPNGTSKNGASVYRIGTTAAFSYFDSTQWVMGTGDPATNPAIPTYTFASTSLTGMPTGQWAVSGSGAGANAPTVTQQAALSPSSANAGWTRGLLSGVAQIGNASIQAALTLKRGSSPVTTNTLTNEGSATIGGNLNVAGTSTFNGKVSFLGGLTEVTQDNLSVKNRVFSVNEGSTTALADGSGMQILGDNDSVVASLFYQASSGRFGQLIAGVMHLFADLDSAQTLTNKTLTSPTINSAAINSPTFSGPVNVPTLASTDNSTGAASTAFVKNAIAGLSSSPSASVYLRRIPVSGAKDGMNTTFTLPNAIIANTEQIFITGGVLLRPSENYTLANPTAANPTITFVNVGDGVTTLTATDTLDVFGVC